MGGGKGGGKGGGSGTGGLQKILQQQVDLQKSQFERETPFYANQLERAQFGTSFLPGVRELVENPKLDEGYKLALGEGINTLRNNLAVTGSPSSGPGQLAIGRFASGLAANQVDQFRNNLFAAAGIQGAPPASQAAGYSSTIGNTAGQIAQMKMAQQQQNASNIFGPIGGLFSLGSGLFGGSGGIPVVGGPGATY